MSISRSRRDVGLTSKLTVGGVCLPRTIAAAMAKSRYPGLADEPMYPWYTGSPTTSETGTTLPGLEGFAINGSTSDSSMVSV